jgi:hypothetical protein
MFVMIASVLQRCHYRPNEEQENIFNALLLYAVSQGCVYEMNFFVKSMWDAETIEELKVPSFLHAGTKPLQHCGGENWCIRKSNNQIDSSNTGKKQKIPNYVKLDSDRNFQLLCSPNFLSLFLETYASPASPNPVLMSPRVNHRNLHFQRIWDARPKSKDPGVIASMLGLRVGGTIRDVSLADLPYHIFPYKITEQSPNNASDSELVFSEGVFSREKNFQFFCRIVTHITVDDVQQLLNVLSSKVCTKTYDLITVTVLLKSHFLWFA